MSVKRKVKVGGLVDMWFDLRRIKRQASAPSPLSVDRRKRPEALTLTPDDVRPLTGHEIRHVRQLAAA